MSGKFKRPAKLADRMQDPLPAERPSPSDLKPPDTLAANSASSVRPLSKRRDRENFVQIGAYIRRDTYKAMRRALVDTNEEISELVERLLAEWLRGRKQSE